MRLFNLPGIILASIIVGISALISTSAHAAPISFNVTSAVSDPALASSRNDHAIYLPFFRSLTGTPLQGNADAADFDFVWDGSLVFDADGNGTLTGTIRSQVDSSFGFNVVFDFSALNGPDRFGPKLELNPNAYVANGGPIDPSFWEFFALNGGTLTGIDSLEGLNFDVFQRENALQLGTGANGKNGNLGASVWFYLNIADGCTNDLCYDLAYVDLNGDINIDLTPVPVPASFILFATGLAGFGVSRRKKLVA